MYDTAKLARALSSETRLQILHLLRNPQRNFESRVEGDLTEDGVCVDLIAAKVGVSQPTASRHLAMLRDAGLVEMVHAAPRRYHRRDEAGIVRAKRALVGDI